MDIVVETAMLKKAVAQLAQLARGSAIIPAVQFIKLVTLDDQVVLSATDTEMWATRSIDAEVSAAGTVCVNASVFNKFLSGVQAESLSLKSEGSNLNIQGDNVKATVNGLPNADYPKVNDNTTNLHRFFDIRTDVFCHHIGRVSEAVSTDASSAAITGIYLHDRDGQIYMVATDRYRLACEPIMKSVTENVSLLIPAKAANYISKLFSEEQQITLHFNEETLVFRGEHTELTTRLLEGGFPDYSSRLPKTFGTEVEANKESLENALRSALVFSRTDSDGLLLTFSESGQTLTIQGQSSTDTVGSAELTTEVKLSGNGLTIRLNGHYVLTALNNIEQDEVSIGLNGDSGPVVFSPKLKESTYLHLVMPLKR